MGTAAAASGWHCRVAVDDFAIDICVHGICQTNEEDTEETPTSPVSTITVVLLDHVAAMPGRSGGYGGVLPRRSSIGEFLGLYRQQWD